MNNSNSKVLDKGLFADARPAIRQSNETRSSTSYVGDVIFGFENIKVENEDSSEDFWAYVKGNN